MPTPTLPRRTGGRKRLILIFLLLGAVIPLRAEAPHYAAQLARECDELMSLAIKRPYGWGWAEDTERAKPKIGSPLVRLEPPGSAGAGFVLYWSGELLDNPKYKQAAFDAARAMQMARQPTGQIPEATLFHQSAPAGHDAAFLVAHRAATRAALGLALTLLDDTGGKDDQFRRMALPSLTWLLKQQAPIGSWPQGYPPTTADAWRMTRLDTPDFRDSVFAMLLAADVLDNTQARLSIERAIHSLIRMRIGAGSKAGEPLWATIYGLDHFPTDRLRDFPPGIDILASRNAMQILLAAHVMLGDPPIRGDDKATWSKPLAEAAEAASKLPRHDGKWIRIYDYEIANTIAPPSTQPAIFSTKPPLIPPSQQTGTWGMDTLIEDAQNLADVGRDKFIAALSANFTMRQRLAAALCGLDDDPFSVDLPVRREDITAYLKNHAGKFAALDEPMPTTLTDRVRRIYLLLIRARLERRIQNQIQ